MSSGARILLATLVALGCAADAAARPEKVRPDHSYYSDDETATGLVHDLVGEMNYEEVYQFYRYYEAVYDEEERVVRFVEYVRGDVVRVERYTYGPDGSLLERVVDRPGQPPEVTIPDRSSTTAPGEPTP